MPGDGLTLTKRLRAQGLSGPKARSPETVVERLLAVQAQDMRGARLGLRPRSTGVSSKDMDHALTASRALLVTWLNRGTLHLVTADDYWWLSPLTTPQLVAGNSRRLRQEGLAPHETDRGVAVVLAAIAARGPLTRAELRDELARAAVPTAGQALVHLLVAATLRGGLVRGPLRNGEHCFITATQWLGPAPGQLDRPEALARLARRYLVGHGPASAADLAKWAGIRLADARAGLERIRDETKSETNEMVDLVGRPSARDLPPPRLLGPFDPLLHGWASRDFVLADHHSIITTNGLFRPFALVRGRAVATWGLANGRVTVHPLEPIAHEDLDELRADADRVLAYLGLPPTPAVVTT